MKVPILFISKLIVEILIVLAITGVVVITSAFVTEILIAIKTKRRVEKIGQRKLNTRLIYDGYQDNAAQAELTCRE